MIIISCIYIYYLYLVYHVQHICWYGEAKCIRPIKPGCTEYYKVDLTANRKQWQVILYNNYNITQYFTICYQNIPGYRFIEFICYCFLINLVIY